MKTCAIVQARMGSSRLPGKVMKNLAGKTVLGQLLVRLARARQLDGVVVATTTAPADEIICAESEKYGVGFFRGSEDDVLSRYHGAAVACGAEAIVRVTSDCPLFDPTVLDEMLVIFRSANRDAVKVDYLSNVERRTFPRGLDAEIFTFAALDRARKEARLDYEREHVTPYIHLHPEWFRIRSFAGAADLSHHRWTLDTPEDWELIKAVYDALSPHGELFSTTDVLKLLNERPELAKLNAHVEQKKLGQ
jgi:spore coat polysaccharide biosynthesis protein SpsF